jgi:hypothetical protein
VLIHGGLSKHLLGNARVHITAHLFQACNILTNADVYQTRCMVPQCLKPLLTYNYVCYNYVHKHTHTHTHTCTHEEVEVTLKLFEEWPTLLPLVTESHVLAATDILILPWQILILRKRCQGAKHFSPRILVKLHNNYSQKIRRNKSGLFPLITLQIKPDTPARCLSSKTSP